MSNDQLIAAMRQAALTRSYDELIEWARRVDGMELFRVLFPLATASQSETGWAWNAARLLYWARPACPIPCKEAVRALLGGWDTSIEEVPWYLDAVFGRQGMLGAIQQLEGESRTAQDLSRLAIIRYWVNVPVEDRWTADLRD
jgi:hypothetical protein